MGRSLQAQETACTMTSCGSNTRSSWPLKENEMVPLHKFLGNISKLLHVDWILGGLIACIFAVLAPLSTRGQAEVTAHAGLPIVDVRSFSGSEWCTQVNAANAANSGRDVILSVPSAMSGMTGCTTSISLSTGHQLSFGTGTFNLGIQTRRAGIVVGHAVNNVVITGQGTGKTILQYTSYVVPLSQGGNAFPWGSAIGLGTVTHCSTPSDANNNIHIRGITFVDLNRGSAQSSTHEASAIDGACVNNVIIEDNQFTDIKGNAAITVTGSYGGG